MTENTTLADLNDQELFSEAMTDDVPADEPVTEDVAAEAEQQPAQTNEQPRDETGRFAAKTEPEAAAEQQVNPDSRIPEWRRAEIAESKRQAEAAAEQARQDLANERAARAELQRRLEALEKPAQQEAAAEEPDPLLDPKGYREFIRKEIQNDILNDRREASLALAHKTYKEEFDQAYSLAQQRVDPALKAKMQASRDPGETLIQWYREQKTMQEVGNDPNAWLEKKLEERLADPAFLAKAMERARGAAQPGTQNGRPAVNLPPSLTSATRANTSHGSDPDDNDLSDEGLFAHATS